MGFVRITSMKYEKASLHQIEGGMWYTSFQIEAEADVQGSTQIEPVIDELMNTRMIAEKFFTQEQFFKNYSLLYTICYM